MGSKFTASIIGNRAKEILEDHACELITRHVFANTLYLEAGRDMIIVTRKDNRSPNTINLFQDTLNIPFYHHVKVQDIVETNECYMYVGDGLKIDLKNAERYTPPQINRIYHINDVHEKMYLKGFNMVTILYSLPSASISILEMGGFREFLKTVVYPFSRGDAEAVKKAERYKALLGVGEGFTPSGDDFILGFISVLNLLDEKLQKPRIAFDEEMLFNHTSWVSAMFLKYAQHGLYDEDLYHLLKSVSSRDEISFTCSILRLARRGHSSGLDTSLGVLTGLASIIDNVKGRNLSEKLINYVLSGSRNNMPPIV